MVLKPNAFKHELYLKLRLYFFQLFGSKYLQNSKDTILLQGLKHPNSLNQVTLRKLMFCCATSSQILKCCCRASKEEFTEGPKNRCENILTEKVSAALSV